MLDRLHAIADTTQTFARIDSLGSLDADFGGTRSGSAIDKVSLQPLSNLAMLDTRSLLTADLQSSSLFVTDATRSLTASPGFLQGLTVLPELTQQVEYAEYEETGEGSIGVVQQALPTDTSENWWITGPPVCESPPECTADYANWLTAWLVKELGQERGTEAASDLIPKVCGAVWRQYEDAGLCPEPKFTDPCPESVVVNCFVSADAWAAEEELRLGGQLVNINVLLALAESGVYTDWTVDELLFFAALTQAQLNDVPRKAAGRVADCHANAVAYAEVEDLQECWERNGAAQDVSLAFTDLSIDASSSYPRLKPLTVGCQPPPGPCSWCPTTGPCPGCPPPPSCPATPVIFYAPWHSTWDIDWNLINSLLAMAGLPPITNPDIAQNIGLGPITNASKFIKITPHLEVLGGQFDRETNHLTANLRLTLQYSEGEKDLPIGEISDLGGDDFADLTLSTHHPLGQPVDNYGNFVLAGSALFKGGFLAGNASDSIRDARNFIVWCFQDTLACKVVVGTIVEALFAAVCMFFNIACVSQLKTEYGFIDKFDDLILALYNDIPPIPSSDEPESVALVVRGRIAQVNELLGLPLTYPEVMIRLNPWRYPERRAPMLRSPNIARRAEFDATAVAGVFQWKWQWKGN